MCKPSVLGSNKRWQRWTGGKCAARASRAPTCSLDRTPVRLCAERICAEDQWKCFAA